MSDKFFRPTSDNVVIELLPEPKRIGLIHVPDQANERRATQTRRAVVLACGPGHYAEVRRKLGSSQHEYTRESRRFIPMALKPGDVVLVLALAGNHYSGMDIVVPRHNPLTRLGSSDPARAERRIIREDEAIAIIEEVAEGSAAE